MSAGISGAGVLAEIVREVAPLVLTPAEAEAIRKRAYKAAGGSSGSSGGYVRVASEADFWSVVFEVTQGVRV